MANEFSRKESVSDYEIYQGREGSQLNFQEEASKIVTGVNAIATEREGKKAKIQTDTDDVIAQLEKADSFQNQTLGQTVLLAAKGLKETLLMQSKLMKKGKIKPADFMATLQTAKDDMANWGIAAKDWNEKYKVSEERQKLDPKTNKIIASGMETAIKESTLAFNNLNNVVPFTSATGNSYLVRLNEDGSMPDFETQKDRYGSFNNMNNLLLYQDDNAKYDLTSLIANEKKNVGAFITSTISGYTVEAGGNIVVTREGAREMEDALKGEEGGTNFTKMVNTLKGSILSDNLSIANILVNESFGDDGYIIAQTEQEFVDKGGKDLSKWIEADYSSQPPSVTLKDGQKTAAEGFVEDKILIQFGQKTTKTKGFAGQQESSSTNTSDKVDVEDAGYISELNDVFTNPNAASSKAILKRLIDSRNAEAKTPEDKIVSFDIEDTRIIIKRGGGQDDLIIDRIGDSGVPNDPNTPEDESLNILDTETDIMSAIDILTPGKGYSRGRVRDLIKSQKITINPRLNRDLKTSVSKPPIKIVTNTTEVSDGKTVIGELEKAIGGTTKGNWDSEVISVVDDIIVGVMSGTLKRELASQGFGSPTTETVTVNGEEYYKIKIAGKETSIRISGGETKTNIANQIVDAINEATKKVNKGRESKTVDSFNIWKRSNPGKSFTDYTAWRKLQ
tara:strand:- start:1488 stop:3515 length:2028 start_codon:yes stop_codon:yes gene_type:complete